MQEALPLLVVACLLLPADHRGSVIAHHRVRVVVLCDGEPTSSRALSIFCLSSSSTRSLKSLRREASVWFRFIALQFFSEVRRLNIGVNVLFQAITARLLVHTVQFGSLTIIATRYVA